MGYRYGVIGAGRQGTAAAYDMAKNGGTEKLLIGDLNIKTAKQSAQRVNSLLNLDIAEAKKINVKNQNELIEFLTGLDAFLSAVPYYFNLEISKAAIKAKASMCDLGGNTEIVKKQLRLDKDAKDAAITIIPDCGQVPGMGTTLCIHAMDLLDKPIEVYMWDGGLPQNPRPPFNYLLTFNIEGLTNEYAEPTYFLRDYKLTEIQPLEELEIVTFPEPIGELEAFTTGGGTSTAPWTFKEQLKVYQNKTVRYPGHYNQLRAFLDLGLFNLTPIEVDGKNVVPRKVFHSLFEPKVTFKKDKDVVVIRVRCIGEKEGKPAEAIVELMDYYDEETGFTAMERTTGWDASITAIMMAHGKIPKGAIPVESAVSSELFVEELSKRGIDVISKVTYLD
jgi:lysine 6-dehydrogenase